MCDQMHSFSGVATNLGHPLAPENVLIRERLIQVFEQWYFAHNNEADSNMCYLKVDPRKGFFNSDGVGYKVDFVKQEVVSFPFDFDPAG